MNLPKKKLSEESMLHILKWREPSPESTASSSSAFDIGIHAFEEVFFKCLYSAIFIAVISGILYFLDKFHLLPGWLQAIWLYLIIFVAMGIPLIMAIIRLFNVLILHKITAPSKYFCPLCNEQLFRINTVNRDPYIYRYPDHYCYNCEQSMPTSIRCPVCNIINGMKNINGHIICPKSNKIIPVYNIPRCDKENMPQLDRNIREKVVKKKNANLYDKFPNLGDYCGKFREYFPGDDLQTYCKEHDYKSSSKTTTGNVTEYHSATYAYKRTYCPICDNKLIPISGEGYLTSETLMTNFDLDTLNKDYKSNWDGFEKSHSYQFLKCDKCNYAFASCSTFTQSYNTQYV